MSEEKDQKGEPLAVINQLTPQAKSLLGLANDSTSHIEISGMGNVHYGPQIVNGVAEVVNPQKLGELLADRHRLLAEAKVQIDKLWEATQGFEAHNNLFKVTFHIKVGEVLKGVRPIFSNDAGYTSWLRDTFGAGRLEYFRHSVRLADMGKTAWKYRSLGVNRLLEVGRMEKILKKSLDKILEEHGFPDTSLDLGGDLFKVTADSIITLYRFKNEGVTNITLDQASQMVQFIHEDIPVKEIKRFKKKYDEAPEKDAFLDKYIMDKMYVEGTKLARTPSGDSLNRILATFNEFFEEKDIGDVAWIKEEREILDRQIFYDAYGHISWIKKKLIDPQKKPKKTSKRRKR